MEERRIKSSWYVGTPGENKSIVDEHPYPVRLVAVKAVQTNDGSATLQVADGAGNEIIAAAALGDSSDPAELTPSSTALAAGYDQVAQDVAVVFTLDYDGDGGTAGQGICINAFYLTGDSA